MDVHQLVGFEQHFHLRPDTGEQGVEIIPAEIAKAQMHHARRRRMRDNAIRKIRVLAHDDKIVLPGKFPNLRIAGVTSHFGHGDDRQRRRKTQPRRQVFIKEKALQAAHAIATTEKWLPITREA